MKSDYYEILGVGRNADSAEIKRVYRNLAMKHHPDRNTGDPQAVEKMKEINEAYAVLSDTQKRRLYDTYGHAGLEDYTQEDIFRGVDFTNLFREFGLGDFFSFGDSLFENLFGRGTTTRRGLRKGTDLRCDLTITLEEVAFGAERTLELPKTEPCPTCDGAGAKPSGLIRCDYCKGTGQIVLEQRSGYSLLRQITACNRCHGQGKIVTQPCRECKGKGSIQKTKKLVVKIPAGADTGYGIRVEGEGEKGEDLPGDLYVVLKVEKHPIFERHGDDIYLPKEIPFTTATFGGEVEVAGLHGKLKLEIPNSTQNGALLRIRNEGISHLDGYGRGDEFIIIKVVTPTNLSQKEKELLREFERLRQKSADENHK